MAERLVISDKGWVDVHPDGTYDVVRPFVVEGYDPGSLAAGIILGQLCTLMDNERSPMRQRVAVGLIAQVDLEAMARGYKVTRVPEDDGVGLLGLLLERVPNGF